MLTLSHNTAVLIGVMMALWMAFAVWAVISGMRLRHRTKAQASRAGQLATMLESAPAMPLLVRSDGRIEAQPRIADLFGLVRLPNFLSDLAQPDAGLEEADASKLVKEVSAAQKTGRVFSMSVQPKGSRRTLSIKGAQAASGVSADGAVLLWIFDATDSQREIVRLAGESEIRDQGRRTLSSLIEAAPVPMWLRKPDGRIVLVNAAYVAAVECESAEDALARQVELVDASSAVSVSTTGTRTVPVTVGGERRTLEIVDVGLGETGTASYALDREDLERSRTAFRHFADTQRTMLDRLSAGVVQFAADRSLVFCNRPFQQVFGIRETWLIERPDFDRMLDRMREASRLPETRDFPAWKAERREWFTTHTGTMEENWLIPGGKHLRLLVQPLPDGGLLLIFEDRTEQAQLASARDTLLRVRTATFDNLFEAVGVFEADGRLHLWNNRFREVWGFDERYLAQHPRVDDLADSAAERLTNPSRSVMIRDLVRSATVERKQRSGRFTMKNGKHYEFAAVPLPDGNALFIMLDITDSRKVETALRERTTALEEADKIKTAFVANMSYELRTPLTSIKGFAEMLDSGLAGKLGAQAKDYVSAILQSTERLGALVDDVLDLTQGDAGALPLDRTSIDVAELVRRAGGAVNGLVKAKAIDFALEIDASAGAVNGDAKRIRQALDHLLRNALTYTPKKGRVLLHASGDEKGAIIVVSDDGPGMDEGQRAAALDRFSRVRSDTARDGESALGLGLPLARQFIEAHGGSFELMSESGVGTAVRIELPR